MRVMGYKNILSKRIQPILLNALNNLLPPLSSIFISLVVVRLSSIGLWGEYARFILLITFLTQIAAWGNKEYLAREFSKTPGQITILWNESIAARSLLLLPLSFFVLMLPTSFAVRICLLFILLLRFILQSYDSIIQYKRIYSLRIVSELFYITAFSLTVILSVNLTIIGLLMITVLLDLVRTILVAALTKLYYKPSLARTSVAYLKKSFLFSLLMFTSLMASRIDQVNAALVLSASEMGTYQILMNFLLILQASSYFVLQPFTKNLYRLPLVTIKKIAWKLFLLGIPLGLMGIAIIKNLLLFFYHIDIDQSLLWSGYLFVLPMFYYCPYIFYLYKTERVLLVTGINIAASLLLLAFSFLLMNFYSKGIQALLLSASLVQYVLLIFYIFWTKEKPSTKIS